MKFNLLLWNGINLLFSRNGNAAELKRLMEWKVKEKKSLLFFSISASFTNQKSNEFNGVELNSN